MPKTSCRKVGDSATRWAIMGMTYWSIMAVFGKTIYNTKADCMSVYEAQKILRPGFADRYRVVEIKMTNLTACHPTARPHVQDVVRGCSVVSAMHE